MAALTRRDIVAAYRNAFNRAPSAAAIAYWIGKEDTVLRDKLRADPNAGGVYKNFVKNGSPASAGQPGDPIINKTTEEARKLEKYKKEEYWNAVRRYGIENPALTKKYGLPPDYNFNLTQFGIASNIYAGNRAIAGQTLDDTIAQYDLDKRNIVNDWTALQNAIQTGQIDPTSDVAVAYQRNLEQRTLALQNTARSLSAHGTLYGGVAQRQTQLAAQPYDQAQADLQRNTQQQYNDAMDTYLGKKKSAQIEYGVDRNPNMAGSQTSFGGGTWDPTTGTFRNVVFGISPQEAARRGLTFFGTNPYNLYTGLQGTKRDITTTAENYWTEQPFTDVANTLNS